MYKKFCLVFIFLILICPLLVISNEIFIFNDVDSNNNSLPIHAKNDRIKVDFSFADENDNLIFSDEFKNTITVLYLWSNWCMDCIQGLKTIDKFIFYLADKGLHNVKVFPIAVRSNLQQVKEFYIHHNILNLKFFIDFNNSVANIFDMNTVPSLIILDFNTSVAVSHVDIMQCNMHCLYNTIGKLLEQG